MSDLTTFILETIAILCIAVGIVLLLWAFFDSFPDWDGLDE